MTREISELMDGELSSESMASLIGRMKQDPGMGEDWSLYHLIGDQLRQAAFYSPALAARVRERLSGEPTVLAPKRPVLSEKARMYAMSVAASLAAVAVVAWIGLRGLVDQPVTEVAVVQPAAVQVQSAAVQVQPAGLPVPSRMNDYLLAHQELSSTTAMQGVAAYVRSVAHSGPDNGR